MRKDSWLGDSLEKKLKNYFLNEEVEKNIKEAVALFEKMTEEKYQQPFESPPVLDQVYNGIETIVRGVKDPEVLNEIADFIKAYSKKDPEMVGEIIYRLGKIVEYAERNNSNPSNVARYVIELIERSLEPNDYDKQEKFLSGIEVISIQNPDVLSKLSDLTKQYDREMFPDIVSLLGSVSSFDKKLLYDALSVIEKHEKGEVRKIIKDVSEVVKRETMEMTPKEVVAKEIRDVLKKYERV